MSGQGQQRKLCCWGGCRSASILLSDDTARWMALAVREFIQRAGLPEGMREDQVQAMRLAVAGILWGSDEDDGLDDDWPPF